MQVPNGFMIITNTRGRLISLNLILV